MFTFHEGTGANERFCSLTGFPLDPAAVQRQAPDLWLLATDAAGVPVARCSLWWKATPTLTSWKVGYLGHFAVTHNEAAQPLFQRASAILCRENCELAIGPVDGSTWQRYRLITQRGDEPTFFLEPDNPDDWPALFQQAGYAALAEYHSSVNTNLDVADPRLPALRERVQQREVSLRPLDVGQFEQELRRVHALSLLAYRENFLFTPITEADFLAKYLPLRDYLGQELAVLAERQGELVGYFFVVPDLLRAKRGDRADTVILKTMAVHPNHEGIGLGSLLMAQAHENARQAGFTRAIHALMHDSNRSGRMSAHTARVFRRYTLFGRFLIP